MRLRNVNAAVGRAAPVVLPVPPRLLDLFCGAGGASMGYHRAGFDVVGVDIMPQPRYPFKFIQADALGEIWSGFDAIHASPPCQAYSAANSLHGRTDHPDLIEETRCLLRACGVPYVIENVERAPLVNPVKLCGLAFGLGVKRHRLFECSFPVMVPPCPNGHPGDWISVFGDGALSRTPAGGHERAKIAMGIDWMTRNELSQAIPPAYTEHIGEYLMIELRRLERCLICK